MAEEKDYIDKIIDVSARKSDIDISKYNREEIRMGMAVEMEHGSINSETDVTGDDPVATLKITLAHLNELPNYYTKLKKMEKKKLDEARRFRELAGIKENEDKKYLHNEQYIDNSEVLEEIVKQENKKILTEASEQSDFTIHEFDSKKTEAKEEDKELYTINESEVDDDFIDLEFLNEDTK